VGKRLILNFGAVDWEAAIYVNGTLIGTHRGGYDPFGFDITDHLRPGKQQELIVGVYDPTDAGDQPRGKQVRSPEGIWYTSSTGIWQTVWLEPLPSSHITDILITPDPGDSSAGVTVHAEGGMPGDIVRATVISGEKTLFSGSGKPGTSSRSLSPGPISGPPRIRSCMICMWPSSGKGRRSTKPGAISACGASGSGRTRKGSHGSS